jgi:hypothetical protein
MASRATAKLEAVTDNDTDKPEEGVVPSEPTPGQKVEAATGEVLDSTDVKTVSWHGLELIVPPEIPPVLMFDFVSMENDQGAFALMRMFMTLLEQEQFVQVRNVIAQLTPEKQIEAITELSEKIMGSYGTTEGESEASSES